MSRITANYDKICFGNVSRKKRRSVKVYLGVHYCNYFAPECTGHGPSSGGLRRQSWESVKGNDAAWHKPSPMDTDSGIH